MKPLILYLLIITFLLMLTNLADAKKRTTVLDRLSNSLTEFIQRKLPVVADEDETSNNNDVSCSPMTLDYLNAFYRQVYSSNSSYFKLTEHELESLIRFHVKRIVRDDRIKQQREKYKCNRNKCIQAKEALSLLNVSSLDYGDFRSICPALLFNLELENCDIDDEPFKLSPGSIWGLGLLFAAIVTLWSWGGLITYKFSKRVYKWALTFMISLAFGVVASNSILKYLPLADGLDYANIEDANNTYFFKHMLILFVILFFFLFERFMKLIAIYKTNKRKEQKKHELNLRRLIKEASEKSMTIDETKKSRMKRNQSIDVNRVELIGTQRLDEITDNFSVIIEEEEEDAEEDSTINSGSESTASKPVFTIENSEESENKAPKIASTLKKKASSLKKKPKERFCCTSLTEGLEHVRPIGWMAIFGDGLGNFIDGLSIGASMNQGLGVGVTTAVATWMGNIPQELGDFALLIRSGMTPFQALFYNYLSSNTCYLGFVIGAVFGSNLASGRWIFSISSATTLYISVGVLLPEIKEEFENERDFKKKLQITLTQIIGILVGYIIVIALNIAEDVWQF